VMEEEEDSCDQVGATLSSGAFRARQTGLVCKPLQTNFSRLPFLPDA